MKRASLILTTVCLLAFAEQVMADDVDDLDVTIDVVEAEEDAGAMMNRIELPFAAAEQAREHAAGGLDTANRAREDGRAFGQAMSERMHQAREQVRDNRTEQAGAMRDNAGGGSDRHAGMGSGNRP